MAELRQFVVSPFQTNCYAVISNDHCMVVDPGDQGARIAQELKDVTVDLIVCTHGHNDHVSGVRALKEATDARFMMPEADYAWAKEHSGKVDGSGMAYGEQIPDADELLHDGDRWKLDELSFEAIAAPGHTPGGMVLLGEGFAFVGDTLFHLSCGRTDLPGGSHAELMETLAKLKRRIPASYTLFCGHGPETTMTEELAHNPWLQDGEHASDGMH